MNITDNGKKAKETYYKIHGETEEESIKRGGKSIRKWFLIYMVFLISYASVISYFSK